MSHENTVRKTLPAGAGFSLPSVIPDLPIVERGTLLTVEQEQSLAYRILIAQFNLLQAISVHVEAVDLIVGQIEAILESNKDISMGVVLVSYRGRWIRAGSVDEEYFKRLVLKKLTRLKVLSRELKSTANSTTGPDLFAAAVRKEMADALCELLPYDLIINQAADLFRKRSKGVSEACKQLEAYVSKSLGMSRRAVAKISMGHWGSPLFIPALACADRYLFSVIPPEVMREFRGGVINHQMQINERAAAGEMAASEAIAAWVHFTKAERCIKESVGAFHAANERLAFKEANRYRFAMDRDQVFSAAQLGLIRAIYKFAPDMGIRFSTFAVTWIRQTILRELGAQDFVRMPDGSHSSINAIRAVITARPNASNSEIARVTGIAEDDVKNFLPFIGGSPVSIDTSVNRNNEEFSIHEIVADPNQFESHLVEEDLSLYLADVVKKVLPVREANVLISRFGIGVEARTLADIATELGMTIEGVRQIERRAVRKLSESEHAADLAELWSLI